MDPPIPRTLNWHNHSMEELIRPPEPSWRSQSIAARLLMEIIYRARMAQCNLLRALSSFAPR
eukprot:8888075-Prorocentrum_lima.AAC.1